MRSTFVSTFLSVTRAPAITASLGSVTTPLIEEEEFCESALVGTKAAATANRRQKVRPDRNQLILLCLMICILLPPEWVKRAERCRLGSSLSCTLSRALGRLREWYKFPNNDVKDIFY
jgi:hypothetical protein